MEPETPIRATSGTNQEGASSHNRRVVIDALRNNGQLSRAELARATSLTKQAISNIVEELNSEGLVEALAAVRRGRGKPFTPYRLVADGAFAIGLQIDRYVARAMLVDFLGSPRVREQAAISERDPQEGVAIITGIIERLCTKLEATGMDRERVIGLGVAMPGPFGIKPRTDDIWMMAPWQAYPLRETLSKRTGLEVEIQNDAVASAIAERMIGAAKGVDNAICLYLGYGIGAGLIINGEFYRGANGNAGELGMVLSPFADDRRPTLEHRASLASLFQVLELDPASSDLQSRIEALVTAEDPRIRAWVNEAARDLRRSIQLLEMLFDPETIILCGGAPRQLGSMLMEAMQPLLPSISDHRDRDAPRLQQGMTDPWSVALGAAVAPISRSFDPRYSAMLKNR
ncbi:MAG: ROK family protein [Rhizobiaceae bacterium]|nr:ROK family protein [Rhizobiaceae bacterium]